MGSSLQGADESFAAKINAMIQASGGRITLVSGFRSSQEQSKLYNAAVAKYGAAGARKWAAPPGHSNHEKGIAADLGGDLKLAAELAPRFGLYRPMGHEPWHFEPVGSRGQASDQAYTDPGADVTGGEEDRHDLGTQLDTFLNILGGDLGMGQDLAPGDTLPSSTGGTDLDKFMNALSGQESGGNYNAHNPSGANGKYQIMPSNWPKWAAEAGLPSNAQQTPENQERVARFKIQQYQTQFGGDMRKVASAWYSGNPDLFDSTKPQKGGPSIKEYVDSVMSRMNGGM